MTELNHTTGARDGVAVVVATRDRPVLLRRTIDSILSQDYDGPIEMIIVFDRSEPDESLIRPDPHRGVRITTNVKTPGLAGARNSGIALVDKPWVAFCDDDGISKIRLWSSPSLLTSPASARRTLSAPR